MKDRTNEEGIDPAGDKPVDEASRPDELERPGGGNGSAADIACPQGSP